MPPPDGPVLIIVTTGLRLYREYLLASIAREHRVHLVTPVEPDWEWSHIVGATVVPDVEAVTVVAAAREIAAATPVAGVMSWHEERIVQAALAAEALGLPGTPAEALRRCRDKLATRSALTGAGLLQPAFRVAGTAEEALAAAQEIGYPVVLKPRAAGGSQGVVLVPDPDELRHQFDATRDVFVSDMPAFDQGVLVEQYLEGPEISVDSAVHRGRVTPVFVARKAIGFPPWFEETGHLVARDPLLDDPGLVDVLDRVHAVLGCTDGWTHTELRLTAEGPAVIEVNGRLGGDLIPYLGLRATGVDPGLAAAAVACGRAPDTAARASSVAGIRFFYPPAEDSVIESVHFDPGALPAQIDLAVPIASAGDVVSPPRRGEIDARLALATVVTGSVEEAHAALDRAEAALEVRVAESTSARISIP